MSETYVLNTRSMIYHTLRCYCDNMIQKENFVIVEGKPVGATPCSKCKPDINNCTTLDEVLA